MGFFKDFREDLTQAAKELMPGSDGEIHVGTNGQQVNTLEQDIDVQSELAKLDGFLKEVKETEPEKKRTMPDSRRTSGSSAPEWTETIAAARAAALEKVKADKRTGEEKRQWSNASGLKNDKPSEKEEQQVSKAAEPEKQVKPEKAAEPEKQVKPEKVAEPEKQVKPEKAAEPEKPVEPKKAAEPEKQVKPKKAAEPEKQVKPKKAAEPERRVKHEKTAEPEKPVKPEKTVEQVQKPVLQEKKTGQEKALEEKLLNLEKALEEKPTDQEKALEEKLLNLEKPVLSPASEAALAQKEEKKEQTIIDTMEETNKMGEVNTMNEKNNMEEVNTMADENTMDEVNTMDAGAGSTPGEKSDVASIFEDSFFEGKPVSDEEATITQGMVVTGNLETTGSVEIQGVIKGNVSCNGKIVVTGAIKGNSEASEFFADTAKIEGEIKSSGTVKIGLGSVIIGNITASSAVIAGAIKGDIDVKGPVVVDTSAVVMGNIKSRSVQINNGAVIEGFCSQAYADVDVDSLFSSSEEQ